MNHPIFILGAGFNKDARNEVGVIKGRSIYGGEYEIQVDYPLADELLEICFSNVDIREQVSIENLFESAIAKNDYEPLKKFYYTIWKADNYLVPRLLPDVGRSLNSYTKFFEKFKNSSFLSFNYDSLVEVFLFRLGTWQPFDGFGVLVETDIDINSEEVDEEKSSTSFVLHLHGSPCIYSVDFELTTQEGDFINWIKLKESPDFIFDPDAITSLFYPYSRIPPRIGGYIPIEKRVIAPVPNKAKGLNEEFIKRVHTKAKSMLQNAEILISIGYSYNPLDKSSYEGLINQFASQEDRKIILIGPDADDLSRRLKETYSDLNWIPMELTFKQWVESGFAGLDS